MAVSDHYYQKEALKSWIQERPWDYFLTITYKQPRKPEQFFVEAQRVESTLQGSSGFLVGEEHKTGYLHLHGLFLPHHNSGQERTELEIELQATWYWERLFRRFGRSEVSPIRKIGGAVGYCAKYMAKDLRNHWWMW